MSGQPPPFREVAEGVYLLERAKVNCYLVVSSDGLVLVDAGLPGTWPVLNAALESLGATPADLDAVVLTHAHFDHVGLSHRLFQEHGIDSHVHENDVALARHPYRYRHEKARALYPWRHPRSVPILGRMVAAGALGVKGITAVGDVRAGEPGPGGLIPVPSPGHTEGHCGYLLGSRGILFAGDAIVTLDPYTGETGPRIVAGAATADSATALRALDAFAQTEATLVLTGHGEPFEGHARDAVHAARAAGAH